MTSERSYMPPGKSTDWGTPRRLFNEWNKRVGPFTLDPCATDYNALCSNYFTANNDGLSKSWAGHTIFINPPYGRGLEKWVKKAWLESQKPNTFIVALLPARTDVKWFHRYVLGKSEIYLLKGRLKFVGAEHGAPFPSMIVVWGSTNNKALSKCKVKGSPLRYPGGKSKAIKKILPLIPLNFNEFREPFVGGGSVFLTLKQLMCDSKFVINDLDPDLYCFWKYVKEDFDIFVSAIQETKERHKDGRALFDFYRLDVELTPLQRAVRLFFLSRVAFSGNIATGGYSDESFRKRFTTSSIDRLKALEPLMEDVEVNCEDYSNIIHQDGENVFIFMDPPYFTTADSKLYGKNGILHTDFDHERLAAEVKKCNHKWLLTYDDCPEIRKLYSFANIHEWELTYGMDNYKQKKTKKGKELFISNYNLTSRICC